MKPKAGTNKKVGAKKKEAKKTAGKLREARKQVKKKAASEVFPFRAALYRDRRVGTMHLESKEVLEWLNDRMKLATSEEGLDVEMKRILETSLHDDSEADSPSHTAWQYGDLFGRLWTHLKKLATEAKNPNVRHDAGRTLGRVIHETRTTEGKKWIKDAEASNEAFQETLVPYFARRGGKPPKADLVRWVNSTMGYHGHLWIEAVETAHRVTLGRFERLDDAWADWAKRKRMPRVHWQQENGEPSTQLFGMAKELYGHCFVTLPFEVLSNFEALWNAGLEGTIRAEWEDEKKEGKIRVEGDKSFVRRFGDRNFREAGYQIAKRQFEKFWWPKWLSHLESEKRVLEMLKKRFAGRARKRASLEELKSMQLKEFLDSD